MKQTAQSEPFFYILIRSWNAFESFDRCVDSVLCQTYTNYQIVFVDDCSNYTTEQKKHIKQKLAGHIVTFNKVRKFSVRNLYEILHRYATNPAAIVVSVDGDDYFSTPTALAYLASIYTKKQPIATYGNCTVENIDTATTHSARVFDSYANTPYPNQRNPTVPIRLQPFRPLHPRTWLLSVFKEIPKNSFLGPNKKWLRFCEDMVLFFPLLEKYPHRVLALKKTLVMYTVSSKHTDLALHSTQLLQEEVYIRRKLHAGNRTTLQKQIFHLHYSKLLSVPLLGSLLYTLQVALLKRGYISRIYASSLVSSSQKNLLSWINEQESKLYVYDSRFGRLLAPLKTTHKVLNLHSSRGKPYDHTWSLVVNDAITTKTKRLIAEYVPPNYPIDYTCVIPYHESFSVLSNFVLETAKTLRNQSHTVFLIAYQKQVWIGNWLYTYLFKRNPTLPTNFGTIITPITILPFPTRWPFKIQSINTIIRDWLLLKQLGSLHQPILWSFDHLDFEFAKKFRNQYSESTVLYDCVDYFGSINPQIDKNIKTREKKLIEHIDYLFVNSHTLLDKKAKLHPFTKLVPQGFAAEAFNSSKPLFHNEAIIIRDLKKQLKSALLVIGFIGNLDYRIDFRLLTEVVANNENYTFIFTDSILVNPSEDVGKNIQLNVEKLRSLPNTLFVPASSNRGYVKALLALFDVGIIPYDSTTTFNKYCFPMKFFEYLYMGLPVISTPIAELTRYTEFVYIASNYHDWTAQLHRLALARNKAPDTKKINRGKELALSHSWHQKVLAILQHIS